MGAAIAAPEAPARARVAVRAATEITSAFRDDVALAVRPGAAAFDGTAWWVGGLFDTADGSARPGLWRSVGGTAWERIATAAVTGYGEVSDLYSIAATAQGVVAIGSATGGAHGNPRTVSWKLTSDNVLREVPASFELYNGIRQIGVRSIVRGPNEWVIFGSRVNRNESLGATSWSSVTGDDFIIHDNDPVLSGGPGKQRQGLDIALAGTQLVAVGEELTTRPGHFDTDGAVWVASDGATWSTWKPSGLNLGGCGDQRAQRIAVLAALNGVREEEKVGQRTLIEVLNQQQTLLASQIQLETTKRDVVVAAYKVVQAIGRLNIAEIGATGSVYDPEAHYVEVRRQWIGLDITHDDGRHEHMDAWQPRVERVPVK